VVGWLLCVRQWRAILSSADFPATLPSESLCINPAMRVDQVYPGPRKDTGQPGQRGKGAQRDAGAGLSAARHGKGHGFPQFPWLCLTEIRHSNACSPVQLQSEPWHCRLVISCRIPTRASTAAFGV
jgi:hypothetical protein